MDKLLIIVYFHNRSCTKLLRDDQAKLLAFVCSSDNETMRNIYDEGR